jgi:hypothetical protein
MTENTEHPNVNPETPSEESPQNPLDSFIYHQRRALEETGKALEALLPEGFREHGSEAGKEFIKSFKVLVDAAITEIEKATNRVEVVTEESDDKPSTTGKTKVKVQVE